jgi:hypothetical protein
MHVHEGDSGVGGPVITPLTQFVSGRSATGYIAAADLTTDKLGKYLSGRYYINIHTAANPNGEIRGQILPETDYGYQADMNGTQETPSVNTSAIGLAGVFLSQDGSKLRINAVVNGLSGPITGAHLHRGAPKQAGPIVADLTLLVTGNSISGTIDTLAGFLADLKSGNVYLNVHTASHPNGEIRGQVLPIPGIPFEGMLDAAQEEPATTATAEGLSLMWLNPTLDTLSLNMLMSGLSGPIEDALLVNGRPGEVGSVDADLLFKVTGDRIVGKLAPAQGLTAKLITDLIGGKAYVNILTGAFPGGEIRGQVYPLARDGYAFDICGAQETPEVNIGASGTGIVSIDRLQTNAHYMIVTEGLSGTPSGAHFHAGMRGVAGPVIKNLSSVFTSPYGFGYWKDADTASPFTLDMSRALKTDSLYFNIHTAAHPGGEIRGQVSNTFTCASILSVEAPEVETQSVQLFPNPASGVVTIEMESPSSYAGRLSVVDMRGDIVLGSEVQIGSGGNRIEVDLGSLSAGSYIVKLERDGGTIFWRRVVVGW